MNWIKKHYHWLIAALAMLHLVIHGGIVNSMSLFLLPVSESFDVSRSAVTLPGSIKTLVSFVFSFFSGALLLRFGYRKFVTICIAVTVSGLLILSSSSNMLLYYVGSILFGATESFCMHMGAPRIVNAWFHRYRGAILGFVMSATGLGGSIMCVVLSDIIENAGWQRAYLTGGLLLAVPLLLIPIFVRNRPEEMGLRPLGEGQLTEKRKKKGNSDSWDGFPYRRVIRCPLFYVLMLGTFLSTLVVYGVFHNLVPHLQDHGFTIQQAATMQSILMFGLAASKFGCGFLSDLIGPKKVFLLCLGAGALSAFLFTLNFTPALALVGVLLCAFSLPLTNVVVPLLSAALFGYQAQTSYLGMLVGMITLAGVLSLPLANLVFDRVGSYNPFLTVCAIGAVCLIVAYLILYKFADREKERFLQNNSEN